MTQSPSETPEAGEPPPADPPPDTGPTVERPWWEGDHLPWSGQPTRLDLVCWGLFFLVGVYGLAMWPLKPILLAAEPFWLVLATGSRTALVALGAQHAAGGDAWWWLAIGVAAVSLIKFDPVFWLAGKLWGQGILDLISGRSTPARARSRKVQDITVRYAPLAILLTHLPIPFPGGIVAAVLGSGRMSLRRFLAYDFGFALVFRAAYFAAGYVWHEEAMVVITVVDRYSTYLALAILAVVLVSVLRASRQAGPERRHDG